ncbi:MAG: exosortase K [Eubacteriales bacterium]|nr:exosortase K [Eubacteriales bacterium]
MTENLKSTIRQNWPFYLIGTAAILGLKLFYRNANADELKWILAPTARWVSILSGIVFQYEPQAGYVNHSSRFLIAASCSGVQFLLICIATLLFSYVHRMPTRREGFYWTAASITVSYSYTIFINGLRIILSIYLPLFLERTRAFDGWLTHEKLHTMIGTAVYFTGLLALYRAAGYISLKISVFCRDDLSQTGLSSYLFPALWYLGFVLGIPFLGRVIRNDWENFREYALLVTALCAALLLAALLLTLSGMHRRKPKKSPRLFGRRKDIF